LGRYPMAWCLHEGTLFVASDVTLLPEGRLFNWSRISKWLENTNDAGIDDFFEGTFRILPGATIRWKSPQNYTLTEQRIEFGTCLDVLELEKMVVEALEITLSEVSNPALMLSDGLDSNLIAAFLRKHGPFVSSTMTSGLDGVCRNDLLHLLAGHLDIPLYFFDIDPFMPFLESSPWTDAPRSGVTQYPGKAYEKPYADDLQARFSPDVILSGFGADQFFYRTPHMLVRWGIAHADEAAIESGIAALSKRQTAALPFLQSTFWRRLRFRERNSWDSPVAFLKSPVFERHEPYFLLTWSWEAAMRSLRESERSVDCSTILPLANERMFEVIRGFSNALHFGRINKPVLRRVASKVLPKHIAAAPKSTSFTPLFDFAMRYISQKHIMASLGPLDKIIKSTAAISHFSEQGAIFRKTRYLVTGEVVLNTI